MNYKIKVEGNIEELTSLFIALGCKYFNHTVSEKNYMIVEDGKGFFCKLKSNFKKSECREISIDQLKDMVVLKRNDISDATHCTGSCGAKGFLSSEGIEYFWDYGMKEWNKHKHSNFAEYQMKPITKEPVMKEFLNPDQGYKLVCCAIGETPIPENWIEVPEGATSYNQYTRGDGDNELFIKLVGDTYGFANKDTSYTWEWYGGSLKGHEFVLWQRETLNDKVASAEVARQDFIRDLSEFNFEAVGVAYGVGFDQDNVNQPSHYCSHPSGIECIEITRHHDFTIGNAIKYLWRAGLKDSADEIQDLEKASWYIQDKINQLKKLNETGCKD